MTQLNLMDVLGAVNSAPSPIDNMSEIAIVKKIGKAVGLDFHKSERFNGSWEATSWKHKSTYDIHFGYFKIDGRRCVEGQKFIGCGSWHKKLQGGAGSPCIDVDEAIEFFKREIERSERRS